MITDPATAAARPDLTFLRHRARPRPAAAAPAASARSAAPAAAARDLRSDAEVHAAIADFVNGRSKHPNRAPRRAAGEARPASSSSADGGISFDRPGRSHGVPPATPGRASAPARSGGSSGGVSFERSGGSHGVPKVTPGRPAAPAASAPPTSAPAAPAGPTPATNSPLSFQRPAAAGSLDLDGSPSGGGSLDLSATPAPATAPAPRRASTRPQHRLPAGAHVRSGQQQLMSINAPTVLLTPVQSGIGQLGIEAVCGPDVGDLRLGAAYQLRSGPTSTVQLASNGNRFAPSSRRPVIVAGRDEFEHLRVDLRQVTDLERMAVYAFSESRAELSWGGTLLITTFGGGRIELPLEALYPGRIAMLISIYNVDGRLVVRAEMETIAGDVRDAARAYGYDRITWRDDRTPVD